MMNNIKNLKISDLKRISYKLYRYGIRSVFVKKQGDALIAIRRTSCKHTDTVRVTETGGIFYAKSSKRIMTSVEVTATKALLSQFTQINTDRILKAVA